MRKMAEVANVPSRVHDSLTIGLHWTTAVLVALQFSIGKTAPLLPRGPLRVDIWSVHVLLGLVLACVVSASVLWRIARRARQPVGRGLLDRLAAATHLVLGALLIIIVVLGILDVFAHAFPLFNTWRFPKLGGTEFMHRINAWHGLVANLVAVIACFHGSAALFHHYVLRDGVLMRMWPGLTGARRHNG